MAIKGLMKCLPGNLPHLEEPCPICLLTKGTKINIDTTNDVYKPPPGFMLQMHSAFFNVESIRVFTLNLLAICSATSHPFGIPPEANVHLLKSSNLLSFH